MVKITDYKGWELFYENRKFVAKRPDYMTIEKDLESEVEFAIDNYEKDRAAAEEESKREEERKARLAEEEKARIEAQKKLMEKIKGDAIIDAVSFSNSLLGVANVVTETNLSFKDGKLLCSQMDPANVSLVGFELDYKGKLEINFCINASRLSRLLKYAVDVFTTKELTIGIETDNKELYAVFKGSFGIWKQKITSGDYTSPSKIPELNNEGDFKVTLDFLRDIVDVCDEASESVRFIIDNSQFGVLAKDEDRGIFENKNIGKASGTANSNYSIEYLKKFFCEEHPVIWGKNVTLKSGVDYPLRVDDEKGNFAILAPRVDDS